MKTTHTATTHTEWAQVIDTATQEGRLYHFNGGQAYIKELFLVTDENKIMTMGVERLLVVDMTQDTPEVTLHDGDFSANYFSNNHPQPTDRESLVPFYKKVDERKLSLVRNEG